MTRLTIAVLGGLDIHLGDGVAALDLPTRKSRAFLAYLALSPGMRRSREHLAGTLWERSAEEQARASLRQTLSSLRRALSGADSPVNADSEFVWLDAQSVEVDALLFERHAALGSAEGLERAVGLYRGELLSGFSLREERFEQWMTAERRRLHERAVQVFSDMVDYYTGADRSDRAITVATAMLALDPSLEWAHRALMRLYLRTGRREAAFRQFEECTRILSEELGVAPAEETRQLAAEIGRRTSTRDPRVGAAAASSASRLPEQPAAAPPPAPEAEPAPVPPAERKHLSVLCSRIRDSIDNPDPEAALERDPVLDAMVNAARRFGGTISQVRDDGVTALFGAPVAQEDHAIRACYAALAMMETLPRPGTLDVRIGIHSAEAVVRTLGNERSRHYDAVGPVSRIATRIDAVLTAGQIGLTADTARRAEGFVELDPLGEKRLEGAPQAIPLYALRAKTALALRWDARTTRELTRFVGREAELARLTELLGRTARGLGQVVTIAGEPGMGKSRLVHEFTRSSLATGCTVLRTGSAPHDVGATYLPIASLVRAWLKVGKHDTQDETAAKLRSSVDVLGTALAPVIAPLAALLDLRPDDAHWATLDPRQRRQRTLEAVKAVVMGESETRPLILIVEDLHWIDAGTQDVLDYLVDGLASSRVLLLFTHRPEYRHGWLARSYFTQLRADPLAGENADRLLRALLGEDDSLAGLRSQLIERTGGTPLFLEESVRTLVEAGTLTGHAGAYRAAGPIAIAQIPATVQAVLAARIDRLTAEQKGVLQAASMIGDEVASELLQPIAGLPPERLNAVLAELQAAEFLYQTRLLPQPQYTFKHALTRQVAYESVLRERRRAVHQQIVEISEALYADRIDEYVERLAHHALAGEQWPKAVDYLLRSAVRAMQRSAHQNAIQDLEKGLEVIERLPDSPERMRRELDYRKALGVTMMAAKGWAAKEVLDAYTRARVLCEALGDERELFVVLRGEGQYRMIRGESRIASELGERCAALAASSGDAGVKIETHHMFWTNSFFMGEYVQADSHSAQGISLYERTRDHGLTYVYSGHDPGVCCRGFSALIHCIDGRPDRSLALCADALELARQVRHPLTMALAHWAYSLAHILRAEPEPARVWAERELAVGEEYLLPLLRSQGIFQLGWALAELGDLDGGIARMQSGLAAAAATGAQMESLYFTALLGEALGKAGKPDAGLAEIERALSAAKLHGARFQLSEMLRLKGELLLMRSNSRVREAEASFRESIEVADRQGAKLPKLRSATSLARLLTGRGKVREALSLVRPAYEAVSGGRDLDDMKAAAALIAEWGGA
jgi:DNA-binding SARP family transcriptional activator/class 3 adenylate cyclase/predicted ATPase